MTNIILESYDNPEIYNTRIDSTDRTYATTPLTVSVKALQNFAVQIGFRNNQIRTTEGLDFFTGAVDYTLERDDPSFFMSKDFEHSTSSIRTWQTTLLSILAVETLTRQIYQTPFLFQSSDEAYYVGFKNNQLEKPVVYQAKGTLDKKLARREVELAEDDLALIESVALQPQNETIKPEKRLAISIFDEDHAFVFQDVKIESREEGQELAVDLNKAMLDYYALPMFFLLQQRTEKNFAYGNEYITFKTKRRTFGMLKVIYEYLITYKDYFLNQIPYDALTLENNVYEDVQAMTSPLNVASFLDIKAAYVGGDGMIML